MDHPVTQAVRELRKLGISFVPRIYDYVDHGGTRQSADQLGVDEHAVIKTLVFETSENKPLIVLMHGDREVSTKALARVLRVKAVEPAAPEKAQRITGYLVGGTSPFGTKTKVPVYAESSIFDLEKIYINGGKRGFLVEIAPADLKDPLASIDVSIAI